MSITRRDALKAGAGASMALSAPLMLAQSGQPIQKTIPKSGETIT